MKHRFVSKYYWKIDASAMSIVDQLAKKFDDVIDLSLGDPDIITHKKIIEGSMQDALNGHTRYTDYRGDPELRQEIRNFYKEEYNMDVADEEIFVTISGTHAMCLALCAVLDPGDEVIVHAPFYTFYLDQIKFAGGIPVILDTYEEENFQVNTQRLEKLITERTKAIIVNTPNNPTGICMKRDTLEKIAEIAKKYDLLVIADDIYTALSYENPFVPIASLDGMKERTIILNSYSKDYCMTGWRIGQIIAIPEILEAVLYANGAMTFVAPSVSQRAAIHAIRNRHEIQPEIIDEYRKRVVYSYKRIEKIGKMKAMLPEGTFYIWVNIKETGLSSNDAMMLILEKAHVLTVDGSSFGACGEGYLRIACTKNIDVLEEAFNRIEKIDEFKK